MPVQIQFQPTDKLIELGGGDNPMIRPNVDIRRGPTVDIEANLEEPLPIGPDLFDGVVSRYAIEHMSWRKVKGFIAEIFRILKPGGKTIIITADTEAQMRKVLDQEDWDGPEPDKGGASCLLFGDQNYEHNLHKNALSPRYAVKLFTAAGFEHVITAPLEECPTDMIIQATKPTHAIQPDGKTATEVKSVATTAMPLTSAASAAVPVPAAPPTPINHDKLTPFERAALFDKHYFNGGTKHGGFREICRDTPQNNVTAWHVLKQKPKSVFELGCGRGYVIKQIQDAGILACGLDISQHAFMTRVADSIHCRDFITWEPASGLPSDLCFSNGFLEHIPESLLPGVIEKIAKISKRGLHGVALGTDGFDKTICTLQPLAWWQKRMPPGHEIMDKALLEQSQNLDHYFPPGDGKIKINAGSHTTMFYHGWQNCDVSDLDGWAANMRYAYARCDVRAGFNVPTGSVDAIYTCHMLEHLSYREGEIFLAECRRVLKPTGALRVIVPDAMRLCRLIDKPTASTWLGHISDGASAAPTACRAIYEVLHAGHQSMYDEATLAAAMEKAALVPIPSSFRPHIADDSPNAAIRQQIQRETIDMLPSISLYMDAVPRVA